MKKAALGLLFLACASALWAPAALAHRIDLFAAVEKGAVVAEASFPGGQPAQGVEITAQDPAGKSLASGKTGKDGKFSFPVPPGLKEPITVIANDHMGHRATFTVRVEDLGG